VIRRVKRRRKGSMNPDLSWAKARMRWVTQLLVRLDKHVFNHTAKENEFLCLTENPTYSNTEMLQPLSVHQTVFFNECHKKTEIGRTGNTVYRFLLIPQVRPEHKYPNSPWEMIHPPGGDNAVCM
jgi:hypothetical protein